MLDFARLLLCLHRRFSCDARFHVREMGYVRSHCLCLRGLSICSLCGFTGGWFTVRWLWRWVFHGRDSSGNSLRWFWVDCMCGECRLGEMQPMGVLWCSLRVRLPIGRVLRSRFGSLDFQSCAIREARGTLLRMMLGIAREICHREDVLWSRNFATLKSGSLRVQEMSARRSGIHSYIRMN